MRLIIVLLLFAAPVQAQDLVFDTTDMELCLQTTSGDVGPDRCIGIAAETCMQVNPSGMSTVGMNGCLDKELTFWDQMLNAEYARVRADAGGIDGEMAADGMGPVSVSDSLRDMQRAWIAYRDASCAFDASIWGNGTGASTATVACLMDMTAKQALLLRDTHLVY